MKNFLRLIGVEFQRIFSNRVLMAIFFGAPVLYGFLFGFVYQQAKVVDLPIVVVDRDQSPASDRLIDALGDNEGLLVSDVRAATGNLLREMPREQYVAIVDIPAGFEADLFQKRHPEVRVDLNMTNILNANTASKGIQSVLMTLNAGIEIEGLKKRGLHPTQAEQGYESFRVSFNKLYNSTGNYLTFMLPGLLGGIMQQVIFLAMALVFARDFEDGYFHRLAGAHRWSPYHLLLKAAPFFLLLPLLWLGVSLFLPYFRTELPIYSAPMLLLTTLLTLACMVIGMLFSVAIPSQLKATELLMVISTPAFVLSGFTWPTVAIPEVISGFARFIPLTQFLSGFRKLAFYGGNLNDILPELRQLTLITLVGLAVMMLVLQLKITRSRRRQPTA